MYFLSKLNRSRVLRHQESWFFYLGCWVPKGPGSSRVLGPLGSWDLKRSTSSRVLQSPGPLFSGMPFEIYYYAMCMIAYCHQFSISNKMAIE